MLASPQTPSAETLSQGEGTKLRVRGYHAYED